MADTPRRPLVAVRRDLEDFEVVPQDVNTASGVGNGDSDTFPFSFTGTRGPLLKIALVNSLLTLLTLGIYRFWAKTRLRRYFWSNIRIQKEPLEYTGTGMELFIGFLIALAILVPIFALYQGALFLLETTSDWTAIALNVIYSLLLLGFFQYAFYRMWRYRFSRTTWRGIRFQLAGSAWTYVGLSMKWLVFTILTLGLAFPWMRNAQWRYRTEHLNFGNLACSYDGQGKPLLRYWAVVWILSTLPITLATIFFLPMLIEFSQFSEASDVDQQEIAMLAKELMTFYAIAFPCSLLGIVLFIWYRVKEFNHFMNNTHIEKSGFVSTVRARSIYGAIALFVFFMFVLGGIFGVAMQAFAYGTLAIGVTPENLQPVFLLMAVLGVIFLIVASVIRVLVLNFNITRHVCANAKITQAGELSKSLQSVSQGPKTGEGLADALDVGAF